MFSRLESPVSVAMAEWIVQHHVFAVEHFFKSNDCVITVQRLFRTHFNVLRNGSIPDRKSILCWVRSFRTTGSIMKQNSSGRPCTARTPENVDRVRASVLESPRRSTRLHTPTLGLSSRSLQHILKNELEFHPYKFMIVQKIYECDHNQRRLFCERMLDVLATDDVLLMTCNEAHFHLDGYVNKQNCRY